MANTKQMSIQAQFKSQRDGNLLVFLLFVLDAFAIAQFTDDRTASALCSTVIDQGKSGSYYFHLTFHCGVLFSCCSLLFALIN
jgi:hypothetical protein